MMTVHEVSKLSGVSIRTLHYYDEIDLLKPAGITEAGYRLYNEENLKRLQTILLFRQLKFPLKEIRELLNRPGFHQEEALNDQIRLLEMQKVQLDKLISLAKSLKSEGGSSMDFTAFDKKEMDAYAKEAKERWGTTKAYQEYEKKSKGRNQKEEQAFGEEFMALFAEFGAMKELSPDDEAVQKQVKKLQNYITEHYYNCTDQILFGLGQMYVADERFQKNIDRVGGEGTAQFVADAIKIYKK